MNRKPNKLYVSAPWKKIRKIVLERDGYRCRIAGPTCTGLATCVDHIVPILYGGAQLDTGNLRAACKTCNVTRANVGRRKPSRQW